jgi:hypothetical protein
VDDDEVDEAAEYMHFINSINRALLRDAVRNDGFCNRNTMKMKILKMMMIPTTSMKMPWSVLTRLID